MSSINDTAAPTEQALLAAEAKDDATHIDTTPTAPADVQLGEEDKSADIERPSAHTVSEPMPEAQAKPGILRKMSSIFSGSSGNNDGDDHSDYSSDTIYSLPFRPRKSVDFAATQQLACQRILQSSGFDTTHLPPVEPVAATARPKTPFEPKPAVDFAATQSLARKRILESSGYDTTRMQATPDERTRTLKQTRARSARLEKQAREVVYDNGWTETSLALMENWFNLCETAASDHTLAAIAARKKHVWVSLPSIVVGSAATGLAFFSVGDDKTDASYTEATAISVALAVLTSALSVLGGLNSLFSLSTRQSLHTTAASNFQNLARKIQLTLFLPVNLRSKCDLILTDLSAEYFSIVEQSPVIYNGW